MEKWPKICWFDMEWPNSRRRARWQGDQITISAMWDFPPSHADSMYSLIVMWHQFEWPSVSRWWERIASGASPIVTHREITEVLLQHVPRSRCKPDYDWVNPRSLRTMSASDDFDNLAEKATCLINSIETTRSMVKFIVWNGAVWVTVVGVYRWMLWKLSL